MSKKTATQNAEVKGEVVETAVEETPETVVVVEEPAKKPNFFKRHWKKIAGIGAAVTAVSGIAFLATRKLSHDDEDQVDYTQALKDYADALKEAAVETATETCSCEECTETTSE